MEKKLYGGEKNLLRLIAKGQQCPDGWAPVSKVLYPLVQKMPSELVEHHKAEDGKGRAKLTAHGEAIVEAMDWL